MMLTPFGLNSRNKSISNFITGVEISIFFILISTNLSYLHQEQRALAIILKTTTTIICAINLASIIIIKLRNKKILEIYDEINLPYSKIYANSNRTLYSTLTWILLHSITYILFMCVMFIARMNTSLVFQVSQNIVFKHHAPITVFFMNGCPLTLQYIYSELNIRYMYVLDDVT